MKGGYSVNTLQQYMNKFLPVVKFLSSLQKNIESETGLRHKQ